MFALKYITTAHRKNTARAINYLLGCLKVKLIINIEIVLL